MTARKAPRPPRVGLVLSGGGARGAYEVGVLRYVRERLGVATPFHVISGCSVGAINGAYLAATSDRPRAQARLLARVWGDINLDEVYYFGWEQLRSIPQLLFGRDLPRGTTHGSTVGGLVDPRFLQAIVHERIPWRGITDNLVRGNLHALTCSATEMTNGITTVFVQSREAKLPQFSKMPGQIVVQTAIMAEHTLASAAIPLLFPAVRIGDQLFVDGSLRHNTPIRPAMYLGAERLLVVGIRYEDEETARIRRGEVPAKAVYPNAMFVLGKMLNALMLDKLEADLLRIERTNELIDAGIREYGPDFPRRIARSMVGRAGRPYTKIDVALIEPSQDLGVMAWDVVRETKLSRYTGMMARWLRRYPDQPDALEENDLASYVLFDREYVHRLIDLGYRDALAQHEKLERLFLEPVHED